MTKYNLVGVDGNAFAIIGYVTKAMKDERKTPSQIGAYRQDAKSSDYNHLLSVSVKMIDELNAKYEDDCDE